MAPKRNILCSKPPEPAFIKRMKESIGYKEPDTVETKREIAAFEDDENEREDEKPMVVVLQSEDLTEEDVKAFTKEAEANKKVMFSKPAKKEIDEKNSLDFSSKKKELQKKLDSHRDTSKKIKNSSLLSFGEDEDY